ncbi:MAG: hypothetical protein AAF368_00140 [Planctomycetota bacterium]
MTKRRLSPFAEGWLVFAASLAFIVVLGNCLATQPVRADDPQTYQGARVRRGDVTTLARMCVGEVDFDSPRACAAMVGVMARRAARRGVSIGQMARNYSVVFRGGTDRREVVIRLRDAPTPPPGWRGASWPIHRWGFRLYERLIAEQLAGQLADPCIDDAPMHYGSLAQDARNMGPDWEVVCRGTHPRQAFWSRRP